MREEDACLHDRLHLVCGQLVRLENHSQTLMIQDRVGPT